MRSVCLLPQAPAVLTSAHHPKVCSRAWAHRCELGRACVGMRGHAWSRARSTRACDAACLYSCVGHSRAKHRPLYQPAEQRHAVRTQVHRSALAQMEHAHGCVAWAHLHLCVLDQLEYKVSSEPSSGRATRLVPASSATSRAAHQDICSRCSGLTSWVEG